MLTTFHRNALDSTLGPWLGPFGVHQVTVPQPPWGRTRGGEGQGGGGGTDRGMPMIPLPDRGLTQDWWMHKKFCRARCLKATV